MAEKSCDEKADPAGVNVSGLPPPSDIRKAGILKKLKTMKKKYFVLRTESESGPARLEYYDSEKKFRAGATPKRSICIKTCFNINRKVDAKQKLVIALYTKDDCFSVVAENETDLEEWLNAMLELQLSGSSVNGNVQLKPKFDNDWYGRKDYSGSPNNIFKEYGCRIYQGKMKRGRNYLSCRMAQFSSPSFLNFKGCHCPIPYHDKCFYMNIC